MGRDRLLVSRAVSPQTHLSLTQADAAADSLALVSATDAAPAALVGLATCHSAEKCADVIVASEVEFKMFQATGWRFVSADGAMPVVLQSPAGDEYTVLQRNDFDNTRQTQSVVVKGPGDRHDIFVKVRVGGAWWSGRR